MNFKAFHYFDNLFIFVEREREWYICGGRERQKERERGKEREREKYFSILLKKNCGERVAYMWRERERERRERKGERDVSATVGLLTCLSLYACFTGTSPIPRSSSVDSGRQPYLRYPSWPAEQVQAKYARSTSNISNRSSQSEPAASSESRKCPTNACWVISNPKCYSFFPK